MSWSHLDAANVLSGVIGAWLSSVQLSSSRELHQDQLRFSQQLHLQQLSAALQQHLQQMSASFVEAAQEADRDVWEQRNSQFNTKLLASTVMFGIGMEVVIEGSIPDSASWWAVCALSLLEASALTFLGNSILLAFVLTRRMSHFMVERAERNAQIRRRLLHRAQEFTTQIGGWANASDANSRGMLDEDGSKEVDENAELIARLVHCIDRFQTELARPVLADQGEDSEYVVSDSTPSFRAFWDEHCDAVARRCTLCFYLGGLLVWLSVALYRGVVLVTEYDNIPASICFMAVCLAGGSAATVVLMREEANERSHYWKWGTLSYPRTERQASGSARRGPML